MEQSYYRDGSIKRLTFVTRAGIQRGTRKQNRGGEGGGGKRRIRDLLEKIERDCDAREILAALSLLNAHGPHVRYTLPTISYDCCRDIRTIILPRGNRENGREGNTPRSELIENDVTLGHVLFFPVTTLALLENNGDFSQIPVLPELQTNNSIVD